MRVLAFVMRILAFVAHVSRVAAKRVPLLGRLGEVPSDARSQAFYETLTTTIFATMPFWVYPLLGWFLFNPKPKWDDALKTGEGLIYASALLGPLVYVITKRYGKFNLRSSSEKARSDPLSMSFPYGGAFVTITALTCAVAGFAFVLQRASSGEMISNTSGVMALSWTLMIGSTVVFFLVTAYSNMLDDLVKDSSNKVVDAQPKQEKEFISRWLEAKS